LPAGRLALVLVALDVDPPRDAVDRPDVAARAQPRQVREIPARGVPCLVSHPADA
jgi:hypothetical protein